MQFAAYFDRLNKVVQKLAAGASGPLKVNLNVATYLLMQGLSYKTLNLPD